MNAIMKRRYITLIEMMVVMFIIVTIIGILGFNYTRTLEEGKAFKTKAGIDKLETILSLAVADNPDLLNNLEGNWTTIVEESPLVKDPKSLTRDGWGVQYDVTVEDGEIIIRSERYEDYIRAHPTMFGK